MLWNFLLLAWYGLKSSTSLPNVRLSAIAIPSISLSRSRAAHKTAYAWAHILVSLLQSWKFKNRDFNGKLLFSLFFRGTLLHLCNCFYSSVPNEPFLLLNRGWYSIRSWVVLWKDLRYLRFELLEFLVYYHSSLTFWICSLRFARFIDQLQKLLAILWYL